MYPVSHRLHNPKDEGLADLVHVWSIVAELLQLLDDRRLASGAHANHEEAVDVVSARLRGACVSSETIVLERKRSSRMMVLWEMLEVAALGRNRGWSRE